MATAEATQEATVQDEKPTNSSTAPTGGAGEQTTDDPAGSPTFDAATLEVDYGMAPGSLSGAKDQASAMEIIRQHADKFLTAGFTAANTPAQPETKTPPTKPAETKAPAEGQPTGMEQILARLDKMEARDRAREDAELDFKQSEVDRRIREEVDKWGSAKYGTSKSRNFDQAREYKAILELAQTQAYGYIAQGQRTPLIEPLLRQVRAFHDRDTAPAKTTEEKQPPLGAPGARGSGGAEEPRSIHHALLNSRR